MASSRYDYVLVGGGLQSGLLSLALLHRSPGVRIALVEAQSHLGGNHTWCFHSRDVPAIARKWLDPVVVATWPEHEVAFPGLQRVLRQPYAAITTERFDAVVSARLRDAEGCAVETGVRADEIASGRVRLADGRVLEGWVVDARGPVAGDRPAGAGYQKFVGLEVELAEAAPIARPVIMDARVPQLDGYRFIYVLPFSSRRVLFEDTYFSDDSRLDEGAVRQRVRDYIEARGLVVARICREESGVLPMPWSGPVPAPLDTPFVAGYRGGWFHPGTGYSLPVAVRVAEAVAALAPRSPTSADLAPLHDRIRRQARFARFLNWMLFRAAEPAERWRILERFYRLPEESIARFYALEMTRRDQARILIGRPPRGLRLPWPRRDADPRHDDEPGVGAR